MVSAVVGELQRRVGRNLRAVRQARGMSQEDLAELLGVHRTYIGSVERGERNLSLRGLEELARGIDVEPLDLLGS